MTCQRKSPRRSNPFGPVVRSARQLAWAWEGHIGVGIENAKVSVIMTVLNEGATLATVLRGLRAQTLVPAEIVICDGGSRDGTLDVLREAQRSKGTDDPEIKVLSRPGSNISEGRNAAIAAARHDLIAVTDAGIRLEKDWLYELVAAMRAHEEHADVKGASGFFLPEVTGVFDTALAGTTLPFRQDVDPDTFLPAGRSMLFQRDAWRDVGGFPEWLDYCEDLVFVQQIEDLTERTTRAMPLAEFSVVRVPPRGSLRSFFRQYYFYARGDGKADLWWKRHFIRYAVYLLLFPMLVAGMRSHRAHRRFWGKWSLLTGGFVYCLRPMQRVWKLSRFRLTALEQIRAMALIPLIRLVGDVAKMLGYPMGWWWRIRHWQRSEIHWRTLMSVRAAKRLRERAAAD